LDETPAYRLAANYPGRAAGPKGFLASPEKIARVVVDSVNTAPDR
jgi:hypothetical protein